MKVAVYPGSFDPITEGHLDIIKRASKVFDEVIVSVLVNPDKKGLFSIEERVKLIEKVTEDIENVKAESFEGLLVDYMKNKDAKVIIKGQFANVIGRVCMDQCMIDVTHIEDVKIGDEVILLGEENGLKFDANDMAEIMGTINYEILCMISHRVPRIYKKNNEIVKVRNYI